MSQAIHPVVFVGAGPGAADLISLRGAQRLAAAEVVLADALADPELRALAPQAEWIDVGKRGFCDSTRQAAIDAMLVRLALVGRRVLRLKGGDASVFGRLEEELAALAAAGLEAEVVPGITAAAAAAAHTQRPLTRRGAGRSVALATAMTQKGMDARGSPRADSEVYYMAGRQLGRLARQLLAAGWPADTPACVVSRAGCADAMASDHRLADLAAAAVLHAGRPAVVTVGVAARPVAPARRTAAEKPCRVDAAQAAGAPSAP